LHLSSLRLDQNRCLLTGLRDYAEQSAAVSADFQR